MKFEPSVNDAASDRTADRATTARASQEHAAERTEEHAATNWSTHFGGRTPSAEMADLLDAWHMLDPRSIEQSDAVRARKQPSLCDAARVLLRERDDAFPVDDVGDIRDEVIDGPAGEIAIRVYTPASMAVADRALPVVVYFHGGGWVVGDIDGYDSSARAVCKAAHAVVVSCHYRQGPEHRFPAAHQDAYAAYRHVVQHARRYGGDPARIAVCGEGAGGNLAAVCCLNARLEGVREPVHQVLIYPIADGAMDSPSHAEMTKAVPFGSSTVRWFFQQYLERKSQAETPAISLIRAASLHGMPPATIVCAELDPLRSEGEALATQLARSGVPVAQRTYAGVTHEFFGLGPVLTSARDAQRFVGERLREAFFGA